MQLEVLALDERESLINKLIEALELFNPKKKIGWSRSAYEGESSPDIDVLNSIRFLVKPRGQGNIYKDNTNEIINSVN